MGHENKYLPLKDDWDYHALTAFIGGMHAAEERKIQMVICKRLERLKKAK